MLALELLQDIFLEFALDVIYDVLKILYLFQRVLELRKEDCIHEEGLCMCLHQGMFEAFFAECIVGGYDGHGL